MDWISAGIRCVFFELLDFNTLTLERVFNKDRKEVWLSSRMRISEMTKIWDLKISEI